MIWPTLGQAEAIGEGMKNAGVYIVLQGCTLLKKKWDVNQIVRHFKSVLLFQLK